MFALFDRDCNIALVTCLQWVKVLRPLAASVPTTRGPVDNWHRSSPSGFCSIHGRRLSLWSSQATRRLSARYRVLDSFVSRCSLHKSCQVGGSWNQRHAVVFLLFIAIGVARPQGGEKLWA